MEKYEAMMSGAATNCGDHDVGPRLGSKKDDFGKGGNEVLVNRLC